MNIFFAGLKVVCMDDTGLPNSSLLPIKPVYGNVYTIREVCPEATRGIGIRICEIVIPLYRLDSGEMVEPHFFGWRFRPATGQSLLAMRQCRAISIVSWNWLTNCFSKAMRHSVRSSYKSRAGIGIGSFPPWLRAHRRRQATRDFGKLGIRHRKFFRLLAVLGRSLGAGLKGSV